MSCPALRNIPRLKLDQALKDLDVVEDPNNRAQVRKAFLKYYDANIPVKYWKLEMSKHFQGTSDLKSFYERTVKNISDTYRNGDCFCLAGPLGVGKTMTMTNILKRAVEKGYAALYVSLTDIVSIQKSENSFHARQELISIDFLAIDEFDPRYMPTDNASDFYGRVLEDMLRNRSNNKLPTIMCTNSPNVVQSFNGDIKESISSLWNYVKIIPVIGADFRKQEK